MRPMPRAARELILLGLFSFSAFVWGISGCGRATLFDPASSAAPPKKLSELGFFVGNGRTQEPAPGVIPYDLNTPLFSDYTEKFRFIKLPPGTKARYHASEAFEFPVGTMIAKTFAYPHDMRDPTKGRRLLETRILMHRSDGWIGLPYVWNDEQTEATLEVAGGIISAEWIHGDGSPRTNDYLIPNVNQCKECHKEKNEIMSPIGPKARHLNRDFVYREGGQSYAENQLAHWTRVGALAELPSPPDKIPRLAAWNDPNSGTLDERARAWLEINCAHCHNPGGHARNSGLDLMASQTRPFDYGVFKPPVAAGRGSGGLRYDIVPGEPDQSILVYRIASTHPDVMMPELGKRLVHEEGVTLIREWVASLQSPETASTPAR